MRRTWGEFTLAYKQNKRGKGYRDIHKHFGPLNDSRMILGRFPDDSRLALIVLGRHNEHFHSRS